jgi:hypothetical protein
MAKDPGDAPEFEDIDSPGFEELPETPSPLPVSAMREARLSPTSKSTGSESSFLVKWKYFKKTNRIIG